VDRQQKENAFLLCLLERPVGDIEFVGLDQGIAGFLSQGCEKCVGHAAADEKGINLAQEMIDDLNLVGDFGAAKDRDEGFLGVFERLSEVRELLFHEEARGRRLYEMGNALGRGVSAMRAAKGVI